MRAGSFESIPIIDVAPLFSGDAQARRQVAQAVRAASVQVGFFYVRGHNVTEDLMRATYLAAKYFFALPEAYTTGSSLMPQKKNPDALELVRGKASRVDADVVRLLSLMKGLPAGYQKDLQEDKEAVFEAADTLAASLEVTAGIVRGLVLRPDAMRAAASREELMAAGLAVALARDGLPFRRAAPPRTVRELSGPPDTRSAGLSHAPFTNVGAAARCRGLPPAASLLSVTPHP